MRATPIRTVSDGVALNEAVKTVLRKVDLNETLIVVTGDHSHTLTIAGYASAAIRSSASRSASTAADPRGRRQALHHHRLRQWPRRHRKEPRGRPDAHHGAGHRPRLPPAVTGFYWKRDPWRRGSRHLRDRPLVASVPGHRRGELHVPRDGFRLGISERAMAPSARQHGCAVAGRSHRRSIAPTWRAPSRLAPPAGPSPLDHARNSPTTSKNRAGASACTQWPASGIAATAAFGNSRRISGRCSGADVVGAAAGRRTGPAPRSARRRAARESPSARACCRPARAAARARRGRPRCSPGSAAGSRARRHRRSARPAGRRPRRAG